MQETRRDFMVLDRYLFVYFTGTEETADAEQVYYALSKDGLHWQDCSNSPVLRSFIGEKGVRDPYLLRLQNNEGFVLMATDLSIYHRGGWDASDATVNGSKNIVFWKSQDLINWSEARLIQVIPDDTGCAWAPEAIFDPERGKYMVFWASTGFSHQTQAVIIASYTRDFENFTDPQVYINRGKDKDIIDTTIIKNSTNFIRASRDGQISIEYASTLNGKWHKTANIQSLDVGIVGDTVEGPEFCYLSGLDQWCLYVDQFASGKGYLPVLTKNIESSDPSEWYIAEDYDFGKQKKRHGCILPISESEYLLIKNSFTGK